MCDGGCGEGLADSSSRDSVFEPRRLSPPDAVESFRNEFLGLLEVVVLYTHGNEKRRQCLQIGCSPEQRI